MPHGQGVLHVKPETKETERGQDCFLGSKRTRWKGLPLWLTRHHSVLGKHDGAVVVTRDMFPELKEQTGWPGSRAGLEAFCGSS